MKLYGDLEVFYPLYFIKIISIIGNFVDRVASPKNISVSVNSDAPAKPKKIFVVPRGNNFLKYNFL